MLFLLVISKSPYICSDYGYKRTSGLTGPCEADESIILPDPCEGTSGNSAYKQSQGYRKVAGDVCKGGDEGSFAAVDNMCFNGKYPGPDCLSCMLCAVLCFQVIRLQSLLYLFSLLLLFFWPYYLLFFLSCVSVGKCTNST